VTSWSGMPTRIRHVPSDECDVVGLAILPMIIMMVCSASMWMEVGSAVIAT